MKVSMNLFTTKQFFSEWELIEKDNYELMEIRPAMSDQISMLSALQWEEIPSKKLWKDEFQKNLSSVIKNYIMLGEQKIFSKRSTNTQSFDIICY